MTQLQLIISLISAVCIVYTIRDIAMWLTGKHNRSNELIDLFDKRIQKHSTLTRQKVMTALKHSINDFVKAN